MANSELYLQETTSGSWRPLLSTDFKSSTSTATTSSPMMVTGVPEQKKFFMLDAATLADGGWDNQAHTVLAAPGTLYYVNLETWQPDGMGDAAKFAGRGKIEFQNNKSDKARNIIAFDVSGSNNYTFAPGVGVEFPHSLNVVSKNLGHSRAYRATIIYD